MRVGEEWRSHTFIKKVEVEANQHLFLFVNLGGKPHPQRGGCRRGSVRKVQKNATFLDQTKTNFSLKKNGQVGMRVNKAEKIGKFLRSEENGTRYQVFCEKIC